MIIFVLSEKRSGGQAAAVSVGVHLTSTEKKKPELVSVCRSLECPSWRRALNLGWMWSWPSPQWPSESHAHAHTCTHTKDKQSEGTCSRLNTQQVYCLCVPCCKNERLSERRQHLVAASSSDLRLLWAKKALYSDTPKWDVLSTSFSMFINVWPGKIPWHFAPFLPLQTLTFTILL